MSQVDPIGDGQPVSDSRGQPSSFFVRQWNNLIQLVFEVQAAAAAALAAQAAANTVANRNINTSGGLQGGGNLTADRTLSLTDTAVTPAAYGDATHVAAFTVDQKGRLTTASNVAISFPGASGDISPFSDGSITKPAAADFTIADDATAGHGTGSKANLTNRGVELTQTIGAASTTQSLFYEAAVSNTLNTLLVYISPNFQETNTNKQYFYGIGVRDNAGKIDSFGLSFNSSTGDTEWQHTTFATISTAPTISALVGGHMAAGRPIWLRLQKVSTNFVFSVSYNGETFTTVTTVSATGFVGSTLNDVGIILYNALSTGTKTMNLDVFSFSKS